MEDSRWNETLEALNLVKSGNLINAKEANDCLDSLGTNNEKSPPQI